MEKYIKAWEHIRTLKGSNCGDYYCRFIDSYIKFEEDEKVIDEMFKEFEKLKKEKEEQIQLKKDLKRLMIIFNNSFINYKNELILTKKSNMYFYLGDIKNSLQLKCKVLEWCSRDCFKTKIYNQEWRNKKEWKENLFCLNAFLNTNFSKDDIEKIYTYIGNCVNRKLTIKFIESGYDLGILKDEKQFKNK